jgi:hypothetical protein
MVVKDELYIFFHGLAQIKFIKNKRTFFYRILFIKNKMRDKKPEILLSGFSRTK